MAVVQNRSYCFFDTEIGPCGLLWNESFIERVQLPEKSAAEAKRRLIDKAKPCREMDLDQCPIWVKDSAERLQRFLLGTQADLSAIPIDLGQSPPFFQKVFQATRAIPSGQTRTYGELARQVGSPNAARAVGQAMGRNPWPLVIPCHRVMAAGGKMGGYSAFGGIQTKQQILAIEIASMMDWKSDFQSSAASAIEQLKKQDEQLATLIERVGPCLLRPKYGSSVFAALTEAIVYQQLHGKAAATIFGRFRALFASEEFPHPSAVLETSDDLLRGVGLSRSKILSIKDLARRIVAGDIPIMADLAKMSDQDIIKILSKVRGIGPWTAQMLLIFDLGRVDVLPDSDFGVRKGFALTFHKRNMPTPEALLKYSIRWKPYRSLAAWYLWQAVDLEKARNKGE